MFVLALTVTTIMNLLTVSMTTDLRRTNTKASTVVCQQVLALPYHSHTLPHERPASARRCAIADVHERAIVQIASLAGNEHKSFRHSHARCDGNVARVAGSQTRGNAGHSYLATVTRASRWNLGNSLL